MQIEWGRTKSCVGPQGRSFPLAAVPYVGNVYFH